MESRATRCSRTSGPVLPLTSLSLQRPLSPSRKSAFFNAAPRNAASSASPRRGTEFVPSSARGRAAPSVSPARKACMCSPTNHPGSFRCALHRGVGQSGGSARSSHSSSSALNLKRSAMVNSIVRIGSVEGEWVKRALTALIRPSSHHMRRRAAFQPAPSRLRHMTSATKP